MFRMIALVICLLCVTLTAFAQTDDICHDQPAAVQQRADDCQPDSARDGYFQPERHRWYSLDINSSEGGSVTPDGLVRVREGETIIVTIRPDRGFYIKQVIIDGRRVDTESVYKFSEIRRDHTAFIEFAPERRR